MEIERKIIFFENHFQKFYVTLSVDVRKKIGYVFRVIKTVKIVPKKFLKQLKGTNGLLEIRVEYQSNIYRIFCCFDSDSLVVLFNAYQKKTQKTDKKELDKAIKLKQKYFKQKSGKNE